MRHVLDEFLYYLVVERGLAENTLLSYSTDLLQFIEYLEKRGVRGWEEVNHGADPGLYNPDAETGPFSCHHFSASGSPQVPL